MQVIASTKKQEFFDKIRSDFFSYSIFQYKIIYSFLSLYKPNINTYEKGSVILPKHFIRTIQY